MSDLQSDCTRVVQYHIILLPWTTLNAGDTRYGMLSIIETVPGVARIEWWGWGGEQPGGG